MRVMYVTKPINLSLLNAISEFKEITYEELKIKYLPPEQRGIIQGVTVMFDPDLKTLESQGYISRDGDVIRFIERQNCPIK